MAGSFGYELDLNTLSEEEKLEVAKQIRTYKEYQPLIHIKKIWLYGNLYPKIGRKYWYRAWYFVQNQILYASEYDLQGWKRECMKFSVQEKRIQERRL